MSSPPLFAATTWQGNSALVVGPYRVFEVLGSGGIGMVYRAVHSTTNQEVALKILSPTVAADSTWRARFIREARQLARLKNAHVVGCSDLGEQDNTLYMALELLRGGDAESLVRRHNGTLPPEIALTVARDAARGLVAVHRARLIHRDIKPSNVLLTENGVAKLGDFGLVQVLDQHRPLTLGDKIVGTPAFMSPEQVEGNLELDFRTDLYSLGSTLYHLLTGRPPFLGTSPWAVLNKVLTSSIPDPRHKTPSISDEIASIVLKAGSHQREDRYRTALGMAEDLDAVLAGKPLSHAPLIPLGETPRIDRVAQRKPRVMIARQPLAPPDAFGDRLRAEGFDLVIVEQSDQVHAQLTNDPPDLLILDLTKSGAINIEALRQLRRRPEHHVLPVLVLCTSREDAVESAWRAGAAQVLVVTHMGADDLVKEVQRSIGMDIGQLQTMPITRRFSAQDARRLTLVDQLSTICGQVRTQLDKLPQAAEPAVLAHALDELAGSLRAAEGPAKALDTGIHTMVCATKALMRELSEMPHHASPAVIRTVARGIDGTARCASANESARLIGRTALIVDDDPVSRLMMVNALRVVGITSEIAGDASTALTSAEKVRYDMVLSDVMMDGLNGFQFVAKLRQLPDWQLVPVIFVTSLADFDQFFRTVPGGACDLIAKPFLLTELGLKALIHLADTPLTPPPTPP